MFEDILIGEFIFLRKIQKYDAEDIYRWRTSESGKYLNHPQNYSLESQVQWIENRNEKEINYIIYPKNSVKNVGMVGIYDVNEIDLVSNVGRLILDWKYIQKSTPYGLEALLLTYNYVFNEMGFRKITGTILGLNTKMIELQKFLGMQQEGHLEKHIYLCDNYQDLFIFSLFKENFEEYKNKINAILNKFR